MAKIPVRATGLEIRRAVHRLGRRRDLSLSQPVWSPLWSSYVNGLLRQNGILPLGLRKSPIMKSRGVDATIAAAFQLQGTHHTCTRTLPRNEKLQPSRPRQLSSGTLSLQICNKIDCFGSLGFFLLHVNYVCKLRVTVSSI